MAINPALSLGIRQPEIQGPMEGFKQTLVLKNMLDTQAMNRQMMATRQQEMSLREQQIEENKVKAEDLRRAQRGMEVYANAVKNNTKAVPGQGFVHDWDGVANEVEQYGFPAIAEHVRTNQAEIDTKTQSNLKTHLENHKAQLSTVDSLFSDVSKETDDEKGAAKYAAAQQRLSTMNLPPDATQGMPAQYGPEAKDWIKQNHDMVTSAQEKLNEVTSSLAQKKVEIEIPEAKAKLHKETKDNESREMESYGQDLFNQKKADDKDFAARWPGDYEASKKAAKDWRTSITRPTASMMELQSFLSGDPIDPNFPDADKPRTPVTYASYKQWLTSGGAVPEIALTERPSKEEYNEPVKGTGLTKGGMYQAAATYGLTGRMPTMGFGSKGPVAAARSGVLNTAAALAQNAGVDLATVQAEYKANQTSLTRLMTQYNQTAVNEQSASKYFDLVKQAGERMDKESWQVAIPALNEYLRTGQIKATGNPAVNNYVGALQTALTEYAKVVTGQTGGSAVSDHARKETANLISKGLSTKSVNDYIDNIVAPEMKNRTDAYLGQINGVSSTVAKFLSGGAPVPEPGGDTKSRRSVEIGGKTFHIGDTVQTDKGPIVIDDINEKGQIRPRK